MIYAANWKLNKSPKETTEFFEKFSEISQSENINGTFIFFPPTLSLSSAATSIKNTSVAWGCQNVALHESGAYTGETSVLHLASMGCPYVLIGHSERRSLFHESTSDTLEKLKLVLKHKMKPILCIGESLEERESGQTGTVLEAQLNPILSELSKDESVILAYEPVWAIGTGKVASPEQVETTLGLINSILVKLIGEEFSERAPLLYGGSVKPNNSGELAKVKGLNGFLVGGASLDPNSFFEIAINSQA